MNIDRHNYEEFFLLGIDNELSAPGKKMLDEFLVQNPDLLEEFTMLQQSVLKPDTIIFDNKNSLIKEISLTDEAQEKLLLLLDNELNAKEKKAAEKLITNEAAVKEEWNILLQTKLSVDETIVFEDKHLLYKKEEDGRVIAFRWWKVAVAAIFIGFGLWGGIKFLNSNRVDKNTDAVAKNNPAGTIKKNDNGLVKEQTNPQAVITVTDESIAAAQSKKNNQTTSANKVDQEKRPAEKQLKERITSNEKDAVAKDQKTEKKPSNNLPKPYFENLNKEERNNNNVANVPQQKQENNFTANSANDSQETKTVKENKYATTAVFTEKNEDNNPNSFDEDDDKTRKTKLGGFLKKAKRMLERKTKIKTGDDNLKVANLSFAIQ